VLKFYFIAQQFLLVGVQGLVLSPGIGYPRYVTDTHTKGTAWFLKSVQWSLANQALPSVYQKKMKELLKVLFPKDNK